MKLVLSATIGIARENEKNSGYQTDEFSDQIFGMNTNLIKKFLCECNYGRFIDF